MSRLLQVHITPISATPDVVTLQEAKDACMVDFPDHDTMITRLIVSSRERLERYTCRVFLRSNCKAIYTQQGRGDRIILSYSDNIDLTGSDYDAALVGESYIETTDEKVELTYVAGYATIPEWIKEVVLMDIAYRYENRGDIAATVINTEVKDYLIPYVNWSMI